MMLPGPSPRKLQPRFSTISGFLNDPGCAPPKGKRDESSHWAAGKGAAPGTHTRVHDGGLPKLVRVIIDTETTPRTQPPRAERQPFLVTLRPFLVTLRGVPPTVPRGRWERSRTVLLCLRRVLLTQHKAKRIQTRCVVGLSLSLSLGPSSPSPRGG